MTTFSKIEYVPKVVEISNGTQGTIDSTIISNLNQPLFSDGIPQMSDTGRAPILPFDIPFAFTKNAFSISAEITLYEYPLSFEYLPPYNSIIVEFHIIQVPSSGLPTGLNTPSGLFESKTVFDPQPPDPANPPPFTYPAYMGNGVGYCNTLVGNIEINNEESIPFVEDIVTTQYYKFRVKADANGTGTPNIWQIRGVARFM